MNSFNWKYIKEDQIRVLSKNYMKNSIRKVMDLRARANKCKLSMLVFFFFDAAKAFDRVQWRFLTHTIEEMGFGLRFKA